MSRMFRKPLAAIDPTMAARYEKFSLLENPFPSSPYVNQESTDKRINGNVYEMSIRAVEYEKIENSFLRSAQTNPNHLRLGYLVDTSYIGRGNGKTAFLVNLQNDINDDFCFDVSGGQNKCFAIYVSPEPGGRTKTFLQLIESLISALLKTSILDQCMALLRFEAITNKGLHTFSETDLVDENSLVQHLNSEAWYIDQKVSVVAVNSAVSEIAAIKELPNGFPFGKRRYSGKLETKVDFENYFFEHLKRGQERLDFLLNDLVSFFAACGFNGCYVFVDDFERVPDFQSARQKRDFALELRSALFDGTSVAARVGFYNWLLVFHAGVPRLIGEAWSEAGVDSRAPISASGEASHIITFEKLSKQHAVLLVKRYLEEYRIINSDVESLFPFTEESLGKIGEQSEFNAARILKLCHELLEAAVIDQCCEEIDVAFVEQHKLGDTSVEKTTVSIVDEEALDLIEKIRSDNAN